MSNFAISQLLAAFALVLDFVTFQLKSRSAVLLCLVSSSLLISVHYLFLGQKTSAIIVGISAARFLTATFSTKALYRNIYFGAALIAFLTTAVAWNDLFVLLASLCATYGSFDGRDRQLRQWMIVAACLFIINDILVGSPLATILDSVFLCGALLGYYRFYYKNRSPVSF